MERLWCGSDADGLWSALRHHLPTTLYAVTPTGFILDWSGKHAGGTEPNDDAESKRRGQRVQHRPTDHCDSGAAGIEYELVEYATVWELECNDADQLVDRPNEPWQCDRSAVGVHVVRPLARLSHCQGQGPTGDLGRECTRSDRQFLHSLLTK